MDEVGRGPLAGPVVAAAVILKKEHVILGLKDSKKLSPKKRSSLFKEIKLNSFWLSLLILEILELPRELLKIWDLKIFL